ncbi:MAG: hypothetical protein EZS26_000271 [Candidatus Ordinivivax streblomastigis]|uniref:CopG family transcriptional regulator n=1 Tax=Candidatus Ordinivivax streblomastigis TaxID=2540710 RepID=A0A5M8P682_9BACT|nr:MAG: hypothetical protein EZS26_000271 [Candidatus Ordinivivax streblomastigis]
MITQTVQKKRKNIDLPLDAFRSLSIKAAAEGKNLKVFIESLLILEAKAMSDEELYRYFNETKLEGNVYLNDTEQKDFETWLGI